MGGLGLSRADAEALDDVVQAEADKAVLYGMNAVRAQLPAAHHGIAVAAYIGTVMSICHGIRDTLGDVATHLQSGGEAVMNWRPLAWRAADVAGSIVAGAVALCAALFAIELALSFVVWRLPRLPDALDFRVSLLVSAGFQAWRWWKQRKSA